ncbi:sugar ABC transporter substrate-binding protein [Microbacterium sp. RD1]|uniref:sugar ABC transporter substrate-binding protein n=1 Tax=Microbacterium sp. RD1 TaxID=3457313 RepID=UPI003FA597FB
MKIHHRIAAAAIVPIAVLGFTACASAGGGETGGGGEEAVKITLIPGVTGLPWGQAMAAGGEAAAEEVGGVDFSVAGPANVDPNAAVKAFQQVVSAGADGVVLNELPPELFTRPVEDAEAAGVAVLPITTAPAPDSTSTSFVGDSGFQLGRLGADAIADALIAQAGSEDVTGDIVTGICVPGLSVLTSRIDGFTERMAERLPGVTVLEPFDSKGDPAANFSVWQQAVAANSDAIAMMGPCQQDVQSLVKIKQDSGATWQLAGFDIDDVAVGGVEDGTVVGLFPLSAYLQGYVATRLLAESLVNDEPLPEGWVETPIVAVTADNVDEIVAREASLDAQAEFWKPYIDDIFSSGSVETRPLAEANE